MQVLLFDWYPSMCILGEDILVHVKGLNASIQQLPATEPARAFTWVVEKVMARHPAGAEMERVVGETHQAVQTEKLKEVGCIFHNPKLSTTWQFRYLGNVLEGTKFENTLQIRRLRPKGPDIHVILLPASARSIALCDGQGQCWPSRLGFEHYYPFYSYAETQANTDRQINEENSHGIRINIICIKTTPGIICKGCKDIR